MLCRSSLPWSSSPSSAEPCPRRARRRAPRRARLKWASGLWQFWLCSAHLPPADGDGAVPARRRPARRASRWPCLALAGWAPGITLGRRLAPSALRRILAGGELGVLQTVHEAHVGPRNREAPRYGLRGQGRGRHLHRPHGAAAHRLRARRRRGPAGGPQHPARAARRDRRRAVDAGPAGHHHRRPDQGGPRRRAPRGDAARRRRRRRAPAPRGVHCARVPGRDERPRPRPRGGQEAEARAHLDVFAHLVPRRGRGPHRRAGLSLRLRTRGPVQRLPPHAVEGDEGRGPSGHALPPPRLPRDLRRRGAPHHDGTTVLAPEEDPGPHRGHLSRLPGPPQPLKPPRHRADGAEPRHGPRPRELHVRVRRRRRRHGRRGDLRPRRPPAVGLGLPGGAIRDRAARGHRHQGELRRRPPFEHLQRHDLLHRHPRPGLRPLLAPRQHPGRVRRRRPLGPGQGPPDGPPRPAQSPLRRGPRGPRQRPLREGGRGPPLPAHVRGPRRQRRRGRRLLAGHVGAGVDVLRAQPPHRERQARRVRAQGDPRRAGRPREALRRGVALRRDRQRDEPAAARALLPRHHQGGPHRHALPQVVPLRHHAPTRVLFPRPPGNRTPRPHAGTAASTPGSTNCSTCTSSPSSSASPTRSARL